MIPYCSDCVNAVTEISACRIKQADKVPYDKLYQFKLTVHCYEGAPRQRLRTVSAINSKEGIAAWLSPLFVNLQCDHYS